MLSQRDDVNDENMTTQNSQRTVDLKKPIDVKLQPATVGNHRLVKGWMDNAKSNLIKKEKAAATMFNIN